MRSWADDQRLAAPAQSIDRSRGEGPPRCCGRAIVAADALIWWGGLPPATLAAVRAAMPQWAAIPDAQLYVCDSCREHLLRHKHVTREAIARGLGLAPGIVAAAWEHDEIFWRRGVSSAPAEVRAQPWWAAYQAKQVP